MKIIKINQYKNIAPLLGKQCRFGSISGIICGFRRTKEGIEYAMAIMSENQGFNMKCFQSISFIFTSNLNNEKGYFGVNKDFIIY